LLFIFSAAVAQADLEPRYREKLSRLESELIVLANEQGSARALFGWIGIGSGAVVAGGGIFLSELSGYSRDEKTIVDIVASGLGLVAMGRGMLALMLPSEAEEYFQEFDGLAQRSDDEIITKIQRGEVYLENLAMHARTARIVGGIGLIGIGAAELACYFIAAPQFATQGFKDAYTYFLIGTGIVSCAMGVTNFIVSSRVEQVWDSYQAWRKGQSAMLPSDRQSPQVALLPTFGGLTVRVSL
jgi:hypothetical protein